jgi:hypothetical protein
MGRERVINALVNALVQDFLVNNTEVNRIVC